MDASEVVERFLFCQEILLTDVPGLGPGTTRMLTTTFARAIIKSKTIKYAFIRMGFS